MRDATQTHATHTPHANTSSQRYVPPARRPPQADSAVAVHSSSRVRGESAGGARIPIPGRDADTLRRGDGLDTEISQPPLGTLSAPIAAFKGCPAASLSQEASGDHALSEVIISFDEVEQASGRLPAKRHA